MAKTKTAVPFRGTAEQEQELRSVIASYEGVQGALMPILQKAQGIYGYLPIEVQKIIAESLGMPLEEVYGVATFYAQFTLNPKGKYTISVCMGTACYVRGSQKVLDSLSSILEIEPGRTSKDGLFTLEATRCLGCCGLAPVMMIGDDVYGRLTGDTAQINEILNKYR